jgi:hypothetical protein
METGESGTKKGIPRCDRCWFFRFRVSKDRALIETGHRPGPKRLMTTGAQSDASSSDAQTALPLNPTQTLTSTGGQADTAPSARQSNAAKDDPSSALLSFFIAGGVAGATSRTVVSPLERIKVSFFFHRVPGICIGLSLIFNGRYCCESPICIVYNAIEIDEPEPFQSGARS